ncbi:hypothetical protein E4U32_007429 [Claviceps aff. humidiphila group G2b]|nr:hypothetical protein E4U32_007429 [Claviceps aff. humidiphila group G2b]
METSRDIDFDDTTCPTRTEEMDIDFDGMACMMSTLISNPQIKMKSLRSRAILGARLNMYLSTHTMESSIPYQTEEMDIDFDGMPYQTEEMDIDFDGMPYQADVDYDNTGAFAPYDECTHFQSSDEDEVLEEPCHPWDTSEHAPTLDAASKYAYELLNSPDDIFKDVLRLTKNQFFRLFQ